MKIIFVKIVLILLINGAKAQEDQSESRSMVLANIGLGYYLPSSDLAERFGANTGMSMELEKIFTKGSSLSLDYQFNFGSNVKEDVFNSYRNENGIIIGINGLGSFTFLRMRANYLGMSIGQSLHKKNLGLKVKVGGGIFAHYVRILDDSRNLVLADDPYRKGFDRLTRGLSLKQEVLYEYNGMSNNYHFNIGLSIMEGFTNPVRSINFDTGLPSERGRLDILYGIKVNWGIPLYKTSMARKYY